MSSPLGEIMLTGTGAAITALYTAEHKLCQQAKEGHYDPQPFQEAIKQLNEYFAGTRKQFCLPLAPEGSAFQQQVWGALQQLQYGETKSYGDIAKTLNLPNAARAVGAANARNPISIFIPCHRVIGANGNLTGYAGGLQAKKWLLAHERTY
jgi:methylated-DNA-[protein]-cysteine S-methyltransferase